MRKTIRYFTFVFMVVTGMIAGIGLLVIDSSLEKAIRPAMLSKEIVFPGPLNINGLQIEKNGDVISNLYGDIPGSAFVVLYCHNGHGNLFHHVETATRIYDLGVSILGIDYRGFGLSAPVEITDMTLIEDVMEAYETLRRHNWEPDRIILYGQGLSAGIQAKLLKNQLVGGWIMENPVPSLQDAMTGRIRRFLTVDRLSLYNALGRYNGEAMVYIDSSVADISAVEKMQSVNKSLVICSDLEENTVPGTDTWNQCMASFFRRLDPAFEPGWHRISPARIRR